MTNSMSFPEKRHRAARVVAVNARDADDLAELLAMLGLTATEVRCPSVLADAPRVPAPRHPSDVERGLATTLLAAVTDSLR